MGVFSSTELREMIVRLDAEILKAQLYAQYWIAASHPGVAAARKLQRGAEPDHSDICIKWVDMTTEEKQKEALGTACSFIDKIGTLTEQKIQYMRMLENTRD